MLNPKSRFTSCPILIKSLIAYVNVLRIDSIVNLST